MSIQDEINRISQAKDDLASAIESKGVTVPPNTTINLYPGLVQQIQQGDSLPEGGTAGQVLGMTNNGAAWTDKDFFLVPIEQNDGEYSTTVTMAQCLDAISKGQILAAVVDGMIIPCSGYGNILNNPEYLEFSTFTWPIAQIGYRIYRNNSISLAITYVDATEIPLDADSGGTKVTEAINDLKNDLQEAQDAFVPQTTTVNGKALSSDVTLYAKDVGALPTQTGNTGQLLGFTADNVVGAVDAPAGGGGSMELISTTGLTTWAEGDSISIPDLLGLDYDAVGIVPLTNGATAADEYGSMNIYPVTSNARTYTLSGININSSKYAETCMRLITILRNAIVSASGGYYHNWGNRGQSDQCAVPAYIYGIKY